MGQITYIGKFDSADQLDKIMYSYQGWHRGTVMSDQRGLTVLLSMLAHGEITITQHSYSFDFNVREDAEVMKIYQELAPQTRWKLFQYTEIEGIRINALRQMRQAGVPFYDDYICYQEGRINVLCGNIDPTRILNHVYWHPELEEFYIFTQPYLSEAGTCDAKYYRFEFSKGAHEMASRFQSATLDMMRSILEKSSVPLPTIPNSERKPTE